MLTKQMKEVLSHIVEESRGHSDKDTLSYLYGQGYGRTVGALKRKGLVYSYHEEVWPTDKGRTLYKSFDSGQS